MTEAESGRDVDVEDCDWRFRAMSVAERDVGVGKDVGSGNGCIDSDGKALEIPQQTKAAGCW